MTVIAWVLLAAYGLEMAVEFGLNALNLRHLRAHGAEIPSEFAGQIDQTLLERTRNYFLEKNRLGLWSAGLDHALVLIFLYAGLLGGYDAWLANMRGPFILTGVIFFLLLTYARTILAMPFQLYQTFSIEKRYGFNTQTFGLWVTDQIKGLGVSTLLLGALLAGGLGLVRIFPQTWWLWVWAFFLLFSLFVLYLSPYVLEPLFNRFRPIDEPVLTAEIRRLLDQVGIRESRLFRMDASRRSRHSNAYFSGIGRVKRIVLFDTLMETMSIPEILAVLAHEAGHWKQKHLLKRLAVTEAVALLTIYASFRILEANHLAGIFGLQDPTFFAQLVILGFILAIVFFPFEPLSNFWSRRHEWEADRFSRNLTGDPESMVGALVKLSKDNLANLHPHPLYAAFHYSHPPVVERIRALRASAPPPEK